MQHWPAPHDRFARRDKQAHRNDLDAGHFDGLDLAIHQSRRVVDAEEVRHAGTVNVGIHQADLGSGPRQAAGDVRRDRTLSHAAFARPDGNDALRGESELPCRFGRTAMFFDRHFDRLVRKAAAQQRRQLLGLFFPQRRGPGSQPQRNGKPAVAQFDAMDLSELHGPAAGFGVLKPAQGVADGRFGEWGRHRCRIPGCCGKLFYVTRTPR